MKEIYLNIGAAIRFRDGAGGSLHKVVVDPKTKQVTDLVIVRGFLQQHDYVIPLAVVEQASEDEIQVALDTHELAGYPQYSEVEFESPVDDWELESYIPHQHVVVWNPLAGYVEGPAAVRPTIRCRVPKGIPFGEEVIGRSTTVRNMNGVVGKIDHLWLALDTWEITHLVVRQGLVPHYFVIPFSWVSTISPEEIYIRGTNTQLKQVAAKQLHQLPVYGGANRVPDVGTLLDENLLIAGEVLDELAADPRTASAVIEVIHEQGVITLMGYVDNEVAHEAAAEIAHHHPSVTSVVNALEVRPKSNDLGIMRAFAQVVNPAINSLEEDHVPSAR